MNVTIWLSGDDLIEYEQIAEVRRITEAGIPTVAPAGTRILLYNPETVAAMLLDGTDGPMAVRPIQSNQTNAANTPQRPYSVTTAVVSQPGMGITPVPVTHGIIGDPSLDATTPTDGRPR